MKNSNFRAAEVYRPNYEKLFDKLSYPTYEEVTAMLNDTGNRIPNRADLLAIHTLELHLELSCLFVCTFPPTGVAGLYSRGMNIHGNTDALSKYLQDITYLFEAVINLIITRKMVDSGNFTVDEISSLSSIFWGNFM